MTDDGASNLQNLQSHNLGFMPLRRPPRPHCCQTPRDIPSPSPSTHYWKTLGHHSEKGGRADFGWPTDVAYLPSGFLAVSDYVKGKVELYDSVGQARVTIAQGLIKPFSLTPDLEGQVMVTDQRSCCVAKFTVTGKLVLTAGSGEVEEPSGVATFPDGWWVCTDTRRHVAMLYNPEGRLVREFGGRGTGFIQMDWPGYVATDSKGRILISDSNNFAVKLFDRNGKYLSRLGGNSKHGRIMYPKGVCVDEKDQMFVVEWGMDRVNMYAPNGKFLRHALTMAETRMGNPHGIDCKAGSSLAVSSRHPVPGIGVFRY